MQHSNGLRKAAQQALEALELVVVDVKTTPTAYEAQRQAIAALRAALSEQPAEQEPDEVKQIAEALRQVGLTLIRTGTGFRVADLGRVEAQTAPQPKAEPQEPFGQVTVVRRPGCVDQHWFYRWPEPPYLDNAAECHVVYTAPQPRKRLTDQQILDIGEKAGAVEGQHMLPVTFARAIETAVWGDTK